MLDATDPPESDDVNDLTNLPSLINDVDFNYFSSSFFDKEDLSAPFLYNEGNLIRTSCGEDSEDSLNESLSLQTTNLLPTYRSDCNDSNIVEISKGEEAICNSFEIYATKQIEYPHIAQTSQKRKANEIDKYSDNKRSPNMLIEIASDLPPLLDLESEFERSVRCKIENNNNNEIVSPPKKKVKTCRSINSKYRDGYILDKKMNINEEEIEKYKQLENCKIECEYCNKIVSISKIFKVSSGRMCCDKCAKERKMKLTDLKNDLFEDFDYENEKLYRCCRLEHARPLFHFIKYSTRNDSYRLVTNCCYCRLYKSQENELKKKV